MICLKRKQYLLGAESWNDFYFSAELTFQESVSKQNFYTCAWAQKKQCHHIIPLTFHLV